MCPSHHHHRHHHHQSPLSGSSSVPSHSPIAAITIPSAPHLPPPSYPRSNSRRRFTMSGAANGPNLPVCEIHHRGTMRSQAELLEVMEMSRRAGEHQADAMIRQIELEVEELRRRESNLKELGPSTGRWPLRWRVSGGAEDIAEKGFPPLVLEPSPVRPQPTDVILNGNTAHPRLILSEDMKSVRCGDRHQLLPDNPERWGGGKTDWDLGVARHSINRKGKIEVTPSNGYWFLSLRERNKYTFRSEPSTDVQLSLYPQKIGIFGL
ncbi:hypothetical protein F7725_004901 [Dissostichus mawsoni]|uniref:SPRY-associated domain-containing protein n=1 Tax=Dissostichus mawsoni TaxID=36200 RepID=A0A7J5XLI7_DISMA|nr:hypothetical protein F7725_004901 [Dissostichus mawsoni]